MRRFLLAPLLTTSVSLVSCDSFRQQGPLSAAERGKRALERCSANDFDGSISECRELPDSATIDAERSKCLSDLLHCFHQHSELARAVDTARSIPLLQERAMGIAYVGAMFADTPEQDKGKKLMAEAIGVAESIQSPPERVIGLTRVGAGLFRSANLEYSSKALKSALSEVARMPAGKETDRVALELGNALAEAWKPEDAYSVAKMIRNDCDRLRVYFRIARSYRQTFKKEREVTFFEMGLRELSAVGSCPNGTSRAELIASICSDLSDPAEKEWVSRLEAIGQPPLVEKQSSESGVEEPARRLAESLGISEVHLSPLGGTPPRFTLSGVANTVNEISSFIVKLQQLPGYGSVELGTSRMILDASGSRKQSFLVNFSRTKQP